MLIPRFKWRGVLVMFLLVATAATIALADGPKLSVLYSFEPLALNTFTSPLGSQPDTRPVLGPRDTVYGMTLNGGLNGNGVIYRYDLPSHHYELMYTFSALDPTGTYNEDGAFPGVALTRGPDESFYGVTQGGGEGGNGTIIKFTTSGELTVLHTFSASDANGHNEDGASPLRAVVIGEDGKLYGTTRTGGENTCGPTGGCGVAWVMDRWGNNFSVLRQFTADEGHAGSLVQAQDGYFYGCAVYPLTSLPTTPPTPLPSGILYRMAPSGNHFEVLYTFSQTDANGDNVDGADCYEPLVETVPGTFYGTASRGGTNGSGAVFKYSLSDPSAVEIVHQFSAVNAAGDNPDGAFPYARLTPGEDGTLYSTASGGGTNGSGVVYRIRPDGDFKVLHTFSATDPVTGANLDGGSPDFGVVLDEDSSLIGIAFDGGNGSSAGLGNSGGTLYKLKLDEEH